MLPNVRPIETLMVNSKYAVNDYSSLSHPSIVDFCSMWSLGSGYTEVALLCCVGHFPGMVWAHLPHLERSVTANQALLF